MSEVDAERSGSNLKLTDTDLQSVSESTHDPAASTTQHEVVIRINEDQKLGVTGAAFLILNKMIGMGSTLLRTINLPSSLKYSIQSSQPPPVSSPLLVRSVSR